VTAWFVCGTAAGRYQEAVSGGRLACHEPLQPARRANPLHAPLSLSKRQLAVFGSITKAFVRAKFKAGRDFASDRTIGAQFVRDDLFGQAKPFLFPQYLIDKLGGARSLWLGTVERVLST